MTERTTRDRRPLLNAIVGVLILGVAAALFWPRGGDDRPPVDSLVLTPESAVEESMQASADAVDVGEAGQAAPDGAAQSSDAQVENAQPSGENFPVRDATLDDKTVASKTPAQSTPTATQSKPLTTQAKPATTQPNTQPQSKPIRSRSGEPSSTGAWFLVVGSYAQAANADDEVERLRDAGIEARNVPGAGKHRVQIGYFQSREEAEAYGRKLKQSLKLDFWVSSR